MKEITYRCNLCHNRHEIKDLYGLYFKGGSDNLINYAPDQTEHHVCSSCAEAIRKFPKKQLTEQATESRLS